MLYVFFWVIPRRLNFICRPQPLCGSLPFHYLLCNRTHPYPVTLLPIGLGYFQAKHSPVWIPQLFSNLVTIHLLAYEDGTECSETSAYKIQTPGNYSEENIQHKKERLTHSYYIFKPTVFRYVYIRMFVARNNDTVEDRFSR